MQLFTDLEKAMAIQAKVSADDTDWFYRIVQTNSPTPEWVIEIRDEDGTLLGCL
jgi:hypothetical protein